MSKCVNYNRFSIEFSVADCAVNYVIVRTVIQAVRGYVVFNNNASLCMSKRRNYNRLSAEFRVTDCTINYVLIRTIIYAIRRNVVFYNNASLCMTKRRNYNRLSAEFRVTDCTINYVLIRTIIYAIRRNAVFYNNASRCMSKRHYNSRLEMITSRAITSLFARSRASGSKCFNPSTHIVTKCRNCVLCNKNLSTNAAMLTLCKTICRTCRLNRLVNNLSVSCCRNYNRLSAKLIATNRAIYYILIRTIIYTIRRNAVFYNNASL